MPEPVIHVSGLRKSYADVEAVRGIGFEIAEGEVFGLLGPNGAGKTTTVEILEGLRDRTAGDVRVLGFDPAADSLQLKQRIGVCLQATNLPEKMRVHEAMRLFGSFYATTVPIDPLLGRLQLTEKRNAFYGTLSGGQKQRLALAMAMINDPKLIFLDEPTTGLDPQVRLEIHNLVQELRDSRRSIILTTHYIEEAERLCDRVAIIDQGRIVASGSPRELIAQTFGASKLEIAFTAPLPEHAVPPLAATLNSTRTGIAMQSGKPARDIAGLVDWVDRQGLDIADIQLHRPTLEDVFLSLTGHRLRD